MFSGIISDLGQVRAISPNGDSRFEFATGYDTAGIEIGASVCCSGVCLTVIEKGKGWFAASVSTETLAITTLADWTEGSPVNLERPLKLGDEMGGHMVSGHVDGVGHVISVTPEGDSRRFLIASPDGLHPLIAPKGSVAVDGVSLTVNEVTNSHFGFNAIPHTLKSTTLGGLEPGAQVNLEIDMLARYVARLLERE
ncbi:MAG: riboflavin synthase [Proteobacteria bacterium]|nr:riboflavin synthase [Pseudomonadota bacterium]